MSTPKVYYSFDFEHDFVNAQKILGINSIEANSIVSHTDWERIKENGLGCIKNWISDQMTFSQCTIVLIGKNTANRPLINYEIKQAWKENKALMGIYIHNLNSIDLGSGQKGKNPFCQFTIDDIDLCKIIRCYDPNESNPLQDIENNIEKWVNESLEIRMEYLFQYEYS